MRHLTRDRKTKCKHKDKTMKAKKIEELNMRSKRKNFVKENNTSLDRNKNYRYW